MDTEEVTEDYIVEFDSDQGVSDSSERCHALKEMGKRRFQGKLMQIKDTNVHNTEFDDRVSTTELHTRPTYPCYVSGTCFQRAQEGAYTAIKIKQEEDDSVDDYYNEASFVGEFLENSGDDLHTDCERYNEKLMAGYTIDNNLKVWEAYFPFS